MKCKAVQDSSHFCIIDCTSVGEAYLEAAWAISFEAPPPQAWLMRNF